jgi:hypothetical protein
MGGVVAGPAEEIARAVREGRIVGAEAALLLLEQAIAEEGVRAAARARRPQARQAAPSDEYEVLFADPTTMVDRQAAAAEQHAASAAALTDDELRDRLFAGTTFEDRHGAYAAGAPAHQAFTGEHSHRHSSFQYGDSVAGSHVHPHVHRGEADHQHEHP